MIYPLTTHSYVTLEVSAIAYEEIKKKLLAADYGHTINASGEIDMHGIALVRGYEKYEHDHECGTCGTPRKCSDPACAFTYLADCEPGTGHLSKK